MEIQHFVRVAIAAAAAASIASPTFASSSDTQPLSYSDVKKIIAKGGGNPKKTKALLVGETVSIKIKVGAENITVNDRDLVFFDCSNLKYLKTGETVVAKVVNYSESEMDSNPIIWLGTCNSTGSQPTTLSANNSTAGGGVSNNTAASAVLGEYTHQYGNVGLKADPKGIKFDIETASPGGRGTCQLKGIAEVKSTVLATYKELDGTCAATFAFDANGVKVKSSNCQDWCGSSAPGLDGYYKKKR